VVVGKILGVVTVGQSPRPDNMTRDIQTVVGSGISVVERGALDGLSLDEIRELQRLPDNYQVVTMLRDGSSVQLPRQAVIDRLQQRITQLEREDGVSATLIMGGAAFPPLVHERPLVRPQKAMFGAVIGMARGSRIGCLVPMEIQFEQIGREWRNLGVDDVVFAAANPYGAEPRERVREGAHAAHEHGADILFMDCAGYDLAMRAAARESFPGPVVLMRSLAAQFAAEIVA
jgi:protein AroM